MPSRALGRAAIFAVGGAIASTASGCYLTHERDTPVVDAAQEEEEDGGGSIVLYGTAPWDSGSVDDEDAGAPIPHYGGPFPMDGGFVPALVDAGAEEDANGGSQVLYGGPPDEG